MHAAYVVWYAYAAYDACAGKLVRTSRSQSLIVFRKERERERARVSERASKRERARARERGRTSKSESLAVLRKEGLEPPELSTSSAEV